MSRLSKFLLVFVVIVFVLACNFVTQPIRDVQDIAKTAESFATAIPIETLKALPSALPVETLQALGTSVPTLDALSTTIAQFGSYLDPKGTPVAEWNNIPIMPEAIAGQAFDDRNYSFRASVSIADVQDFYNAKLKDLGWNQMMDLPGGTDVGLMLFQKGSDILTITITPKESDVVVLLTRA